MSWPIIGFVYVDSRINIKDNTRFCFILSGCSTSRGLQANSEFVLAAGRQVPSSVSELIEVLNLELPGTTTHPDSRNEFLLHVATKF
jgi:hypothetical protein